MSRHHRDRDDDRGLVRDALRRAAGDGEPDVTRLVESVPALMAEARRRRRAEVRAAPSLADRARRAIPRLAVATIVVVAIAMTVSFLDRDTTTSASGTYDSLVLAGAEGGTADSSDLLLDAVTKGDE